MTIRTLQFTVDADPRTGMVVSCPKGQLTDGDDLMGVIIHCYMILKGIGCTDKEFDRSLTILRNNYERRKVS